MLKRSRLPHWHVIGQRLFVTVRLHNSLPAHRAVPPSNLTSVEAFVTMDHLLDQARCGPTFLRQPAIAQLVLTSVQNGAEIGHYELHSSKLLSSLKAATARRANLLLQRSGQPFSQGES